MEPWQSILLAFGGNAFLLVVLAVLGRSLLSQWLSKDVERFKAALQAESQSSSERLRHQLQRAALEHQVAFSKLHERRAEVVEESYRLLVELQFHASLLPAHLASERQAGLRAAEAKAKEFREFFDRSRIVLPRQACDRLDAFQEGLWKAFGDYSLFLLLQRIPDADSSSFQAAQSAAWHRACQYIEKELPRTRAVLEEEFRSLLSAQASAT
jgi:hypothetical protein